MKPNTPRDEGIVIKTFGIQIYCGPGAKDYRWHEVKGVPFASPSREVAAIVRQRLKQKDINRSCVSEFPL